MKLIIIVRQMMSALVFILGLGACADNSGSKSELVNQSEEAYDGQVNMEDTNETAHIENYNTLQDINKTRKETLYDQSFNMPIGTINVPNSWKLHQNIASDLNSGGFLHFMLAIESPDGIIYGFLPFTTNYAIMNAYGNVSGMDADEVLSFLMRYSTQPFIEKFNLGSIDRKPIDTQTEAGKMVVQATQQLVYQAASMGYAAQPVTETSDLEFTAYRYNVPYKGKIRAHRFGVSVQYDAYSWANYGTISGGIFAAPESKYKEAIAVDYDKILDFQMNEEWNSARIQLIERASADRMAAQKGQFDLHQRSMASMRRSFDEHNKAWYERNFSVGSSSSSSGNTAVLDAITGQTTFNDPYTGQQIKQPGHYDYWYTNEFGEYHGTNDPNYKPGDDFIGNWTQIRPVGQ